MLFYAKFTVCFIQNVADQAWTEMMVLRKIYSTRISREALQDFDTAAVPFPYGYNPPSDNLQDIKPGNLTCVL